jgi:hypothetical protein
MVFKKTLKYNISVQCTDIIFLSGCPGWGANPGPLYFIYFLIFTTLLLATAAPRTEVNLFIVKVPYNLRLKILAEILHLCIDLY